MNADNAAVPISTKWLLDALGDDGRATVAAVLMIIASTTQSKGTGFSLPSGLVLTNEHVIRGCAESRIKAHDTMGIPHDVEIVAIDTNRDLAALRISPAIRAGLPLDLAEVDIGCQVSAWGYPLGYNGPAPLLTVGHLSGFIDARPTESGKAATKHLVINGALNPGNSGGPLLRSGATSVIGVVCSKHAPMPEVLLRSIEALASNQSGVVYTYTEPTGAAHQFVESQIVAEVLEHFRRMTQVVIGEAIAAGEVAAFLNENSLK